MERGQWCVRRMEGGFPAKGERRKRRGARRMPGRRVSNRNQKVRAGPEVNTKKNNLQATLTAPGARLGHLVCYMLFSLSYVTRDPSSSMVPSGLTDVQGPGVFQGEPRLLPPPFRFSSPNTSTTPLLSSQKRMPPPRFQLGCVPGLQPPHGPRRGQCDPSQHIAQWGQLRRQPG